MRAFGGRRYWKVGLSKGLTFVQAKSFQLNFLASYQQPSAVNGDPKSKHECHGHLQASPKQLAHFHMISRSSIPLLYGCAHLAAFLFCARICLGAELSSPRTYQSLLVEWLSKRCTSFHYPQHCPFHLVSLLSYRLRQSPSSTCWRKRLIKHRQD